MGTPSQRLLQAHCRWASLLCKSSSSPLPLVPRPIPNNLSPSKLRSDMSPPLACLLLEFLATGTVNCYKLHAALTRRLLIPWSLRRDHQTCFWGWGHSHQLEVVGHSTAVLTPGWGKGPLRVSYCLVTAQFPGSWIPSPGCDLENLSDVTLSGPVL